MDLTRRRFIRNSALGAVGLGLVEPILGRTAGSLLAAASGRSIVVVNLFGGNDGLNTVVPLDQYDRYRQLRRSLAHRQEDLLPLAGVPDLALNPGLTGIRDLYARGKLAVLAGVGVPAEATGLFDHSAQQFEFQTCDLVRASSGLPPTGWLGRYLDGVPAGVVAPGIDLGGGKLMLTGSVFDPLTIYSIDDLQLQVSQDESARRAAYEAVQNIPHADPVGEHNRELRLAGLAQAEQIRLATEAYVPAVAYPDSYLAYNLQQCAKIISGNLGVQAFCVGTGGFDTHDEQNEGGGGAALGYHDTLLKDVSDALAAFQADLEAHGLSDRVLTLSISEFGRTAYVNGDRGTDHGFSSVAFAIGDAVNGGVYGLYPSLADQHLVFDGLTDVTTDFRSVYSTALASFLETDPVPVVGGTFPLLGYL